MFFFKKKGDAAPTSEVQTQPKPAAADVSFSVMPSIGGASVGSVPAEGSGIFDQPAKQGGFLKRWWILGVIVVLVIIAAIVFAVLLRPKASSEQPAATPTPPPAVSPEPGGQTEVSSTVGVDEAASIATITIRSTSGEDLTGVIITALAPEAHAALTIPSDTTLVNPVFRIDVPASFAGGSHPVEITYRLGVASSLSEGKKLSLVATTDNTTTLVRVGDVSITEERATVQHNLTRQLFVGTVAEGSSAPQAPPASSVGLAAEVPSAPDSDQDGLTDTEEQLFETDKLNPDTDGDTYKDGGEVIAGFNPRKGNRADLATSGLVNQYSNPLFGYTIYYPAKFLARSIDETNREVLFTAVTGELITISVDDQVQHPTLAAWYKEQFPDVSDTVQLTTTISGVEAFYSPDGLSVYFLKDGRLFAITYNPAAVTQLGYPTVFKRMLKDFTFKKPNT